MKNILKYKKQSNARREQTTCKIRRTTITWLEIIKNKKTTKKNQPAERHFNIIMGSSELPRKIIKPFIDNSSKHFLIKMNQYPSQFNNFTAFSSSFLDVNYLDFTFFVTQSKLTHQNAWGLVIVLKNIPQNYLFCMNHLWDYD